jgi:vacuolar-type H+-ATPase subunit E/Vma4
MTLERLVEEVRQRAEAELHKERERVDTEVKKLEGERDRRVAQIREESQRLTQLDAARDRAQKLAGAKLSGRKLAYEARERQMAASLAAARQMLSDLTSSPEYPSVLKRMNAMAVEQLGKQIRVQGRAADAAALKSASGKAFDPTPLPILGGLVAETADGSRRLNLAFDELLRLREDRVRGLLGQ